MKYEHSEYSLTTFATPGTTFNRHFGGQFDADKLETHISYHIEIIPPDEVQKNTNISLGGGVLIVIG